MRTSGRGGEEEEKSEAARAVHTQQQDALQHTKLGARTNEGTITKWLKRKGGEESIYTITEWGSVGLASDACLLG